MPSSRVLIVDDEPLVLFFVKVALESRGFDVVTAENAERALQMVQEQPEIAVVLSDVIMPGMKGPQLVRKVTEHTPTIKVALMSGDTGDETLDPQIPFLAKPFGLRLLIKTIEELCARQKLLVLETQALMETTVERVTELQAEMGVSIELVRKFSCAKAVEGT